MVQATTFGKKKSLPDPRRDDERELLAKHARKHHLPPPPDPQPDAGLEAAASRAEPEISPGFLHGLAETRIPWLSYALIALLIWIFCSENIPAFGFSVYLFGKMLPPLFAAGAATRDALFAGQWWRLFTATLLHDGIVDFASNVVSIFIAGHLFERHIGRPWFAALFVASSMGGILGGLLLNDHDTFISGAAGGTMGVLAAAFACSFIFQGEQLKKHMQRTASWLLVPTLFPALWPFLTDGSLDPELGMPLGGAIVGGLMGYLLCTVWGEDAAHPSHERNAIGFVAGYAVLAAAGFATIALR
jgi:membrane associated rhomboid family serine protease